MLRLEAYAELSCMLEHRWWGVSAEAYAVYMLVLNVGMSF